MSLIQLVPYRLDHRSRQEIPIRLPAIQRLSCPELIPRRQVTYAITPEHGSPLSLRAKVRARFKVLNLFFISDY